MGNTYNNYLSEQEKADTVLADEDRYAAGYSGLLHPPQIGEKPLGGRGRTLSVVGSRVLDDQGSVERHLLAIDSLGLPAFSCNAAGRVANMNQSAWRLTCRNHLLSVRNRCLEPIDRAARALFHSAIALAGASQNAPGQSLLARMNDDFGDCVRIDIRPFPGLRTSCRAAPVLVICQIPLSDDALAIDLLRTSFDLTQAEAEVALLMARAARFPAIASARSVSEHTVRTQSKTLFSKLGVNTQAQLVYKLRAVAG